MYISKCSSVVKPTPGTRTSHTSTTKTITHIDTQYVKGDTKYIHDKIPVYILPGDSTADYVYNIDEKDLTGTLTVKAKGVVKDYSLSYNVMNTYITKTDTIIITNTDSVETTITIPNKNRFYIGGQFDFSKLSIAGVGVNLTWQTKNYYQFYVGYNLFKVGNYYNIGVKIPLNSDK